MLRRIKLFIAILISRTATFLSHKLGRGGSSIPGQLALKFVPDVLKLITLPETVIAVTGSNGKTSTVEMITAVLLEAGKKVAWNKEGSNQIEGVATFLLNHCSLSGRVQADVVVLETDERYARYTFRYFHPTHYVITNLYRDQLTRNGHPEWVYAAIKDSIFPETKLLLNADDPLVAKFGFEREQELRGAGQPEKMAKVLYFGAGPLESDEASNASVYHDGAYCPVCGRPMHYAYFHYNHIGSYACECGFKRPKTRWTLTQADLTRGEIEINGQYRIQLPFSSLYQCYNTLAAFSILDEIGVDPALSCRVLGAYQTKMGRIVRFHLEGEEGISGTALVSKHENSISYDQSIRVVAKDAEKSQVLIIVDAVSRKYFTSDTSWLWDIDFENLNIPSLQRVILSGVYCHDLATRFKLTGIPAEKIVVEPAIPNAVEMMKGAERQTDYVITCFSDIDKFKTLDMVVLE